MRIIPKSLSATALLFLALRCSKGLWMWHYSVAAATCSTAPPKKIFWTPMIERMVRDDMASFERNWRGEDALSTLNGNNGHIGYLAHLNLMLGAFRAVGGDARCDHLHRSISAALARRILESPHHDLETFPGQIFIPDNAAAIASLRSPNRP